MNSTKEHDICTAGVVVYHVYTIVHVEYSGICLYRCMYMHHNDSNNDTWMILILFFIFLVFTISTKKWMSLLVLIGQN
jgi:hypothetical protein